MNEYKHNSKSKSKRETKKKKTNRNVNGRDDKKSDGKRINERVYYGQGPVEIASLSGMKENLYTVES
jgi:hypothetical protein